MGKNLIRYASVGLILLLAFSLCTMKVFAAQNNLVLKKGMSCNEVKALQSCLKKLGFFNQDPTGYYGDATEAAVRKFQKKYGIPVTGVVATLTYNKLDTLLKPSAAKKNDSKPAQAQNTQKPDGLKMGMTSPEVLKLQNNLKLLGYMADAPTGNFGPITESALIQFQKNFGLNPSGIAGPDTLAVAERLVKQADSVSRGGEDRTVIKPIYEVKLQWIPGLPRAPYLKGIGKYEGVVIHFTDNMQDTAQMEADYEKAHWSNAFVHEFIDPKEIIQVANPDYKAWGAGKYANDRFIHLELCHADTQSDFDISFKMIVQRAAEYLYRLRLGVSPAKADGTGTLWGHMDVTKYLGGTDHNDPVAYFLKWGKSWDDVISSVTEAYNLLSSNGNNKEVSKAADKEDNKESDKEASKEDNQKDSNENNQEDDRENTITVSE